MPENILIIDDDEELCEELSGILADEGYSVEMAFDGALGKALLRSKNFDLIILDLKLPKITGYEILKFIKSTMPDIPPKVLILSGRPIDRRFWDTQEIYLNDEERTLRSADRIINKPFDVTWLLQSIREIFASR